MRTTLTLDPDVTALLRRAMKGGRRLRDVVNQALRVGLTSGAPSPRPRERYRTPPFDSGRCLVGSLVSVAEALAVAEGEAFR
jgi:hypothetical protein